MKRDGTEDDPRANLTDLNLEDTFYRHLGVRCPVCVVAFNMRDMQDCRIVLALAGDKFECRHSACSNHRKNNRIRL